MKTAKISLGDEQYTVGPLTLAQLRAIGVGSADLANSVSEDPIETERKWYTTTFQIISDAIGKPVAEVEEIKGADRPQLFEAQRKIFILTGLIKEKEDAKDKPPGEAEGARTG